MSRISAVLFDFGGTLDGDGLHWQKRFALAYTQAGLALDPERFVSAYRRAERFLATERDLGGQSYAEMLRAQVEAQADALGLAHESVTDVVGICVREGSEALVRNRSVLQAMKSRGLGTAIVSNFPGNLDIVCVEFGYTELCDALIDSTRVGVSKPDPKIFEIARSRLDVPVEECLFVGDSLERDILPSRAAGFQTAWLLEPGAPAPLESEADFVLHKLDELPALIDGLRLQMGDAAAPTGR